ncbi:helix-turn-helix domain-containing protein [Mycoplasma sp. P36-A1]|uniref:helix-turn-helix domain-containing protein n=1 Tax=Mycoplasma sp. P36-A1 TaxID=3252900 RepID=UPI003C2F0B95
MRKGSLDQYISNIDVISNVLAGWFACTRQLNNLTLHDVAKVLAIVPQTVSNWESGKGFPDIDLFMNYCKVVKVDTNSYNFLTLEYFAEREEATRKKLIMDLIELLMMDHQDLLDNLDICEKTYL